jgi:transcription elongation factor S-II
MIDIQTNQDILTSSIFLEKKFITDTCKKLTSKQIFLFSSEINRYESFNHIIKLIHNIDQSIDIEAGLFEFSIMYTLSHNLSSDYIYSIYQDKLNDLLFNITHNEILFKKIEENKIVCQEIPFLSPRLLCPDKWNEQIKKQELKEYKKNNIASTDLYECYKCHARKCSVIQMQLRSADEPMTNIITCLNCRNVWKI